MTKDEMIARIADSEAWVPGKRIKIDFSDQGVMLLDGVDRRVSTEDAPADTTIRLTWEDWKALGKRELNPMTAFMSGKIKVEGDLSGAMALQGVIGKLAG